MKFLSTLTLALTLSLHCYAQPGITATIQNMHLWRGGEVADGGVITTDIHYTFASEHLRVGFWGGANLAGDYKEFNNYISYREGGLSVTVIDTYNFSDNATYNNEEFFNYHPSHSGRFLDATIAYDFGDKFPVTLSWATVIFGRDRDSANEHNRYSTFCSASYCLYDKNSWHIEAGLGAAFALHNIDNFANFYSEEGGVVEITLKTSYDISIRNYTIPLCAVAMWNPQSDKGYLQLSAQIVTF